MAEVSLVGVGNMGVALGRRLLSAGHAVRVWNRTVSKTDSLVELGAELCPDVRSALSSGDLVIGCLLDYPTTFETLAGADGVAFAGRPLVQFAIGSVEDARRLEAWMHERGGRYLAGFIKAYPRQIGTDAAELHISGPREAFDEVEAILASIGQPRFISPDVTVGTRLNNSSVALMESTLGAFFESTTYALSQGVPVETIMSVFPTTMKIVRSTVEFSAVELADEAPGQPAVEAAIDVHANALAAVLAALTADGFEHTVARATLARFQEARDAGLGGREMAALVESI